MLRIIQWVKDAAIASLVQANTYIKQIFPTLHQAIADIPEAIHETTSLIATNNRINALFKSSLIINAIRYALPISLIKIGKTTAINSISYYCDLKDENKLTLETTFDYTVLLVWYSQNYLRMVVHNIILSIAGIIEINNAIKQEETVRVSYEEASTTETSKK